MPDVRIATAAAGSAALRGYLAVPSGEGPWPGVVAIHEIFGLTPVMRRQADRLAQAGFVTLAPDLYTDGGARRCVVSTMREVVSGKPGAGLDNIEAARLELLADERCTGRVGVIGFCMGGGFALLAATRGFDAAATNYGQVPSAPERTLAGACPIVGSYGAKDLSLRGAAGKLERSLGELGVAHDVKEYPSAGHSFLNDEYLGPEFTHGLQRIAHVGPDPVAAPDAWARIDAFFRTYLGPDSDPNRSQ